MESLSTGPKISIPRLIIIGFEHNVDGNDGTVPNKIAAIGTHCESTPCIKETAHSSSLELLVFRGVRLCFLGMGSRGAHTGLALTFGKLPLGLEEWRGPYGDSALRSTHRQRHATLSPHTPDAAGIGGGVPLFRRPPHRRERPLPGSPVRFHVVAWS